MHRKRSKIKNKKYNDIPGWQLEVLRTGWLEWWQDQEGHRLPRGEMFKRGAFSAMKNKQLVVWKQIRDSVDISDYPYAAKHLEGEI